MPGILFDTDGNFEWALVIALIALVGTLFNTYINYRNNEKNLTQQKDLAEDSFQKNIISTARIQWIQEVRKQCVQFISSCFTVIEYKKRVWTDYTDTTEIELNELIRDMEKEGSLLLLYFGPDRSQNNDFIAYLINLLISKIGNKKKWYDDSGLEYMEQFVIALRDFIRIYLKAEWKRSIGELKESELESYLESQPEYGDILHAFKDGIESEKERLNAFYNSIKNDH